MLAAVGPAAAPDGHHHAVKFYSGDDSLFTTVAEFLSDGLAQDQPANELSWMLSTTSSLMAALSTGRSVAAGCRLSLKTARGRNPTRSQEEGDYPPGRRLDPP
jgi:hypothetical protein